LSVAIKVVAAKNGGIELSPFSHKGWFSQSYAKGHNFPVQKGTIVYLWHSRRETRLAYE